MMNCPQSATRRSQTSTDDDFSLAREGDVTYSVLCRLSSHLFLQTNVELTLLARTLVRWPLRASSRSYRPQH